MAQKSKITISKPAFIKEHEKLVKILRTGSLKELREEAAEQSKELKGKR